MLFSEPPHISPELTESCRDSGDWVPILFEWYKYTGLCSCNLAAIRHCSPSVIVADKMHYWITIGLLNRMARLMLSNVKLSQEGFFGETTCILDRCILESAVKLTWLTSAGHTDGFQRFIAESLKTDLKLKKVITKNIERNDGQVQAIEDRMLRSIENYINDSGLSEQEVLKTPKLQNLFTMTNELGDVDRRFYDCFQSMGSHHVHGNWSSLILHYLTRTEEGDYVARDHGDPTHVGQYTSVPLVVIIALKSFIEWSLVESEDRIVLIEHLNELDKIIKDINHELAGEDFAFVAKNE